MSSFTCRCRECGARRTLDKHPDEYMNHIACRSCKTKDPYVVDTYRQSKKESKRYTCRCGGLPYPHRKGGSVFCTHSEKEPTLEDMYRLTDSLRKCIQV